MNASTPLPERRLPAQDLARIAAFAALIAVLGLPGQIQVFGGAVPITAQSLGVMLAGAVLGGRRGALAVLVFLALVTAGLPLLAGGRGGAGVWAGPSAGYLAGFPIGAYVIGRIVEGGGVRLSPLRAATACVVGGIGVVHALGVPVLAWRAHMPLGEALEKGTLVFLPGDALKAALAASIALGVHRAYPTLARERAAARARVAGTDDAVAGTLDGASSRPTDAGEDRTVR